MKTMNCPVDKCEFVGNLDKETWIEHFKKEHKDIKVLNLGGEEIKL